jgi:hypothetical protein
MIKLIKKTIDHFKKHGTFRKVYGDEPLFEGSLWLVNYGTGQKYLNLAALPEEIRLEFDSYEDIESYWAYLEEKYRDTL